MSILNLKQKPAQKNLDILIKSLGNISAPLTIYDAASKSGLSLTDTKSALNYLVAEYRGNLAATSQGELLYSFPYGFSKPWQTKERFEKFFDKCKNLLLGSLKFLVRAWISIVMVGYVVIFAVIIIALSFSKSSDRDDSPSFGSSLMMHALLRMVMDSLFWTFHPFSPFHARYDSYYDNYSYRRAPVKKIPFYESVNRFFFGIEEKPQTLEEKTALVLQEIRAQKGRIGILDVMKVTGLSKKEADPFITSLMLNYDGDVIVSSDGGIYYEFADLRKTSLNEPSAHPAPVWSTKALMPPFTGNSFGTNFLIFGLNAFNLVMSSVAIAGSWTVEHLQFILATAKNPQARLVLQPDFGTPLILGWIPFCFSLFLFSIPLIRLFFRSDKERKVRIYNGRNGILKAILTKLKPQGIEEKVILNSWQEQTGSAPLEREVVREVVKLGGELEIVDSTPFFRFNDLESEALALQNARAKSSAKESYVGEIVFDSSR